MLLGLNSGLLTLALFISPTGMLMWGEAQLYRFVVPWLWLCLSDLVVPPVREA